MIEAGAIIRPFRGVVPRVDPAAWIAPGAVVIGDVAIGAGASVWYNTVIRGDEMPIRIGARSNIQDGSVVHITGGKFGALIGDDVLIGHKALIHGATLQDRSFVGMGATVMDGCVVETGAMVAAGALLTPGKRVKAGEMWAGSPAKFLRLLTPEEVANFPRACAHYADLAAAHRDSVS